MYNIGRVQNNNTGLKNLSERIATYFVIHKDARNKISIKQNEKITNKIQKIRSI